MEAPISPSGPPSGRLREKWKKHDKNITFKKVFIVMDGCHRKKQDGKNSEIHSLPGKMYTIVSEMCRKG